MFSVDLCSFARMVVRMSHVTMRGMCVVGSLFVIAGLMMFCGFFVMVRGVLVMRRRMRMMLMCLVCCGHVRSLEFG